MRIDSHQHFWNYNRERDAWITAEMAALQRDFTPPDLTQELAANQIDGTIAVQADQSERETEFLLDLASQHDYIKGVVGWVDLRASNLRERLPHFSKSPKLRGFRHVAQSEPDDGFLAREDFVRGVAQLAEFGFTYDILIYARQLPAAIALAERLPNQPFVLDHIAKPAIRSGESANWSSGIRALAEHPNVYCKLSGLITEADWHSWHPHDFRRYLHVVLEAFGPDRVMFGSDWPVCLLAGSYTQVKQLIADAVSDWPRRDREKVFGENAMRFYSLQQGEPSGSSTSR
jgi:L-fucono-1,5-lactonase